MEKARLYLRPLSVSIFLPNYFSPIEEWTLNTKTIIVIVFISWELALFHHHFPYGLMIHQEVFCCDFNGWNEGQDPLCDVLLLSLKMNFIRITSTIMPLCILIIMILGHLIV